MASLFTKIIRREIPAAFVFEDDQCVAIQDIQAQAPVHILIIPKEEIVSVATASTGHQALMGHLLLVAAKIARDHKLEPNGYRLVINTGRDGGQSVGHVHVHLLGGRPLAWPPG